MLDIIYAMTSIIDMSVYLGLLLAFVIIYHVLNLNARFIFELYKQTML